MTKNQNDAVSIHFEIYRIIAVDERETTKNTYFKFLVDYITALEAITLLLFKIPYHDENYTPV